MRSDLTLAILLVMAAPANAAELVIDGGFDDPASAAWSFEQYDVSSTIERSLVDSAGAVGSGSLFLRKATGEPPNSLRATQCFDIVPGAEYALSAQLFWPSSSSVDDGNPYLVVQWNESPSCTGGEVGNFFANLFAPERDAWVPIGPSVTQAPPDARSARLYAGVVITLPAAVGAPPYFEASWDDVSFVPEPLAGASIAAIAVLAALARRRMRPE